MNSYPFSLRAGLLLLALFACSPNVTSSDEEIAPGFGLDGGIAIPSVSFTPITEICVSPHIPFITSLEILPMPIVEESPARIPFRDPVFGSCVMRITDRDRDIDPEDSSTGLKNEYSRVQSFNADGSLILVRGLEGTWYLYSALTFEPLGQIPLKTDPRWSSTDPLLLYYIDGTSLISYNLLDNTTLSVHDFAAEVPGAVIAWTRYEGSPSLDGRYWGLMAEDENWLTLAFIVYDITTDSVIAKRDISDWDETEREIDSVTISPLGNYFIAQMDKACEMGSLGSDEHPCGLMVYDRHLESGRSLLRIIGHSDTALNTTGQEVMVFQDIDTDNISMLDLETGVTFPLLPIDFTHSAIGLHFSGRAYELPGWVLISTHTGDPVSYTWMDNSIFAVELMQDGRVVRFAHTHSIVNDRMEQDYWAEPHASVNLDFTRILFTTNWGRSGTGEVEMYLIELRPGWTDNIP